MLMMLLLQQLSRNSPKCFVWSSGTAATCLADWEIATGIGHQQLFLLFLSFLLQSLLTPQTLKPVLVVFIVIATATTASTELYNCTTQCRTLHLAITQHRAAPEHNTHTNTNLVSFSHSLQLPPIQLTSSPLNNNIAPTVELELTDRLMKWWRLWR